ncbi:MAG: glycosyltransferase [Proteobacteria bacterium]|nr:glycosyltransferase [Pseudomonadota bacterium]
MSRIALINIGMHGHVNPTLGFVKELTRRGHLVDFYSTPEFAEQIIRTGAHFVAYPSTIGHSSAEHAVAQADAAQRGVPPPPALSTTVRVLTEFATTLPVLMQELTARPPDLIIYDFVSMATMAVAKQLGIKTIKFFTTYASNEHYDLIRESFGKYDFPSPEEIARAQAMVDGVCAQAGCGSLSLLDAFTAVAADNLVFMPRGFQPHGETFDERFHFVGPCVRSVDPTEAIDLLPPGDGPVLVISLGSLYHEWTQFYLDCIRAFSGSKWRVVMSIGAKLDPASLGQIPANFTIRAHIPQVALLEVADLFISHGGMNSTMEALANGVPMVVIPQIEEQEITARRVDTMALGAYLPRTGFTSELIAQAVEDVAASAVIKANVLGMQAQVIAAGGSKSAADLIEARLGGAATQPPRRPGSRTLAHEDTTGG